MERINWCESRIEVIYTVRYVLMEQMERVYVWKEKERLRLWWVRRHGEKYEVVRRMFGDRRKWWERVVLRKAAVKGSRGKGNSSLIPVSGRQIACDANDWLKLLPPLRTAANMTANKGAVERCRIPAVAQLSPKISQTGALLLLLLHSPASH